MSWKVKAQDSADGTARDHLHRSAHHHPLAVGRNCEFSQRLHRRVDGQPAVLGDLQIARDVHDRFGGNRIALFIVEVEGGTDWRGPHIHEYQVGGDQSPIGEMRKVQGRLPASASRPVHWHHRQGGEDAVAGIQLYGYSGEHVLRLARCSAPTLRSRTYRSR